MKGSGSTRGGWFAPQIHREHYGGPLFEGWRLRAWLDLNCNADYMTGVVQMTAREMTVAWDTSLGTLQRWLGQMEGAGYLTCEALGETARAGRRIVIPAIRDRCVQNQEWNNVWHKNDTIGGTIDGTIKSSNGAGEPGVGGTMSGTIGGTKTIQSLEHVVIKKEVTKELQLIEEPSLRSGPPDALDESQPGDGDGQRSAGGARRTTAGARAGGLAQDSANAPVGGSARGVSEAWGAASGNDGSRDSGSGASGSAGPAVERPHGNGSGPHAGGEFARTADGGAGNPASAGTRPDAPPANGNGARRHERVGGAPAGHPLPPGSAPDGDSRAPPVLSLVPLDAAPEPPPDRVQANELVAAWIDKQTVRPSDRALGIESAAAKRICDQYTRAQVGAAWRGMDLIFPFAPRRGGKGEPWGITDMEKHFHKAAQAAVEQHPAVKRERRSRELDEAFDRLGLP